MRQAWTRSPALARLLRSQDGVISRQQVLDQGGRASDIRRKRRRREWAVVHDGVYVQHTGPITRKQRQWAAVLACAPAFLHRGSALDAHGFTRDHLPQGGHEPVWLAVDAARRVTRRTASGSSGYDASPPGRCRSDDLRG